MKTNKYWQVLLSFTLAIFLVVIIPTLVAPQNEPNDSKANIPSIKSLVEPLKQKCIEIENRGFVPDNQQPNTKTLCEEIEKLYVTTSRNKTRNRILYGTLSALLIYFLSGFSFLVWGAICKRNYDPNSENKIWMLSLLIREYKAIVLIPIFVGIAILLVLIFEQIAGNIELKFYDQFYFKGASGPIIFWILCFLTLVTGLNRLWVGDKVTKDD